MERLAGLTEMFPESVLSVTTQALQLSYWLVRRGTWVVATTAALAFLPAIIEQQRVEAEDFEAARKKQVCVCVWVGVCVCVCAYISLSVVHC